MKVIGKQRNSKDCIMCGMDNPFGVKAPYYVLENKNVATIFKYDYYHQSYPNRVHGGLITAMLDELGCRAYWAEYNPLQTAVTLDLLTKYRKPVPYNEEIIGYGKVTKDSNRYFIAECFLYNKDGECLASCEAKYLKLQVEQICDSSIDDEMPYLIEDDVKEINIKGVL